MNRSTNSTLSLTGVVLLTMLAGFPISSFANDGYQSATSVRVGNRDRGDHHDRHRSHNRGGYHHRDSHHSRHHRPRGHAYGYYARPDYYVVPRYRSYYEPRYYDRRSGWDVDLHYYFRD